jgi:hypothetical protein
MEGTGETLNHMQLKVMYFNESLILTMNSKTEMLPLTSNNKSPMEVAISLVWIRRYNGRIQTHIGNKDCVVCQCFIACVN